MEKKHEYLICIDSDGCAMNTMSIKHIQCFGPCMIAEWNLEQWDEKLLDRWNEINLYEESRGINRFKGLLQILKEVNEQYRPVEDLIDLENWVARTNELSEAALEREIQETHAPILEKALHWSQAVNRSIAALDVNLKQPFIGVRQALQKASGKADVVIVSSANRQAVEEEWKRCGLLPYVSEVMAQDNGSKAQCIASLLLKGYSRNCVLMVGDAMGDLVAADRNGVYFYPIQGRKEAASWEIFQKEILEQFCSGHYGAEDQKRWTQQFRDNFHEKESGRRA